MIRFFTEDIRFNLSDKQKIKKWLTNVALSEQKEIGEVSIIFCSDEHILQINRQYLQHDYYTDIITFDDTENKVINGDMFISVETVKANAEEYDQPFNRELCRVMVHGVLHLCGYKDATAQQQKAMRAAEDRYLGDADMLTN